MKNQYKIVQHVKWCYSGNKYVYVYKFEYTSNLSHIPKCFETFNEIVMDASKYISIGAYQSTTIKIIDNYGAVIKKCTLKNHQL